MPRVHSSRLRVRSCLLAGALGDAWGSAYEGSGPGKERPFPARPVFSDDTALTLATCEALTQSGGVVEPNVIAERFRVWFESGRIPGVGSATLKALRDLSNGAHWALSGARGEFAAGSGAAMRVAPLAFTSNLDRQTIRDVCRITHHNDDAYAGALAVVVALRSAVTSRGVAPDLLAVVAEELPDTALKDRLEMLATRSREPLENLASLGSSGHVVDTVPLALAAASRHASSVAGVIQATVELGGDTDTVASIAAQVVGAGGATVPEDLVHRVPDHRDVSAVIEAFASALHVVAQYD